MERSRLVHAILTREIHARPDVNNMVDFNTKLFIISLTFFRDFLSLEAENTLFFNDVERNSIFFFSYLYLFSAQMSEKVDYFENCQIGKNQFSQFSELVRADRAVRPASSHTWLALLDSK